MLEGAVEREWKRDRRGVGSGVRGSVDYRLSCPAQTRVGDTPEETGPRVERVGGGRPRSWRRDLREYVMHPGTNPGSVPVGVRAGFGPPIPRSWPGLRFHQKLVSVLR